MFNSVHSEERTNYRMKSNYDLSNEYAIELRVSFDLRHNTSFPSDSFECVEVAGFVKILLPLLRDSTFSF